MNQRAIVLVSGGLDSATTLALAKSRGHDCVPLTFRYGQRHAVELAAASRVCTQLGVRAPLVVEIDLRAFGGSALTGDLPVPKGRSQSEIASGIPATYVPARNIIFLSYALGAAEAFGAGDIFLGVNAVDYSGYPDCRPEFIAAFEHMANLGTKAGVEGRPLNIRAPLSGMTKAEIIRLGLSLGVDYALTHSCYDPVGTLACGRCDSCRIRLKGFADAGVKDPVQYA
ncbi:MAG: 7-cyano-7-deazaguanine synthase QueC [Planctomycetes bacterium]|nr:7-cyano-7-deazaguanine synthase QueC [Planctomycetota bacterium]MCL4729097.1 7-cyano-7-deazaguanine synthase QueC [Planctomycetota bacterium]